MDQEVFGLEFGDPGPGWKVGQAKVCVKAGLCGHERLIISLSVAWGSITVHGQVKARRRWPE